MADKIHNLTCAGRDLRNDLGCQRQCRTDEGGFFLVGYLQPFVVTSRKPTNVQLWAESFLAQPLADWPLLAPAVASHPDWSPAVLARFRETLTATVSGQIRPAFERYLAFLQKEALPRTRRDDQVGLVFLPHGAACYRARIRAHTTLERDPRELHQLGLDQIEKLDREIAELGQSALGSADLAQTLVARGYKVEVATSHTPARTTDEHRGVRIHSLDITGGREQFVTNGSYQVRGMIE